MIYGVSLPLPPLAGVAAVGAPRASIGFRSTVQPVRGGYGLPGGKRGRFSTLIYLGGHCYPHQSQLISTPKRFAGEAGERTVR